MASIKHKKIAISAHALGLALFSVNAFAATTVNVVTELEQKLMNAGSAAVAASGLSGYTLKAATFSGSFGATPLVLEGTVPDSKPFSATSQAICACTPGEYTLNSSNMGQVESGETFTSNESLTTDTTVTVEGNYGAVSAKATTNIQTNKSTTSSETTNTLSQSNVGSSAKVDLTCAKYNQPQCFMGTGSTNKITYTTADNSENIPYSYEVYPVNNGSNDFSQATFTATLFKQGTTTAGNGTNFMLYDGDNKLKYEQAKSPEPGNCFVAYSENSALFTSGTYKKLSKFQIIQVGSPANTVSIRFKNKKDVWSDYYYFNLNAGFVDIPQGWRKDDLRAVQFCNNYYITTGDVTQTKDIKISDVINYDTAKHTVTGTYNATDFQSLSMNVNYTQYSWGYLNKNPSNYTDSINECGKTLAEVKQKWRAACSSPTTKAKKALLFKKFVNKTGGPVNLPAGGKLLGGGDRK